MKINITAELKTKLDILTNDYNCEIGGYLVGEIKNGEVCLNDILIPSQNVSSVNVNISPQNQIELRKKYGLLCTKIIGHFHSHHSMSAFWSSTDLNNMRNIMGYKDVFVFIVGSRKDGYKCRLSISKPIKYDFEELKLYPKTLKLELMRMWVEKIFERNGVNINKEGGQNEQTDEEAEY